MAPADFFEVIHSARAMRRFKADSVPDELITQILEAAVSAPSGGNAQDWLFVIITDPEQRRRVGAVYAKASQMVRPFYSNATKPAHMTEAEYQRLKSSGFYLHEHMGEAPVLILVAAKKKAPRQYGGIDAAVEARNQLCTRMASIYPAVQNIILACRALGLGTVLTTNHTLCEDEMKAVIGLPEEVETFALLPVGYPPDNFGGVRRKPLGEVVIRDRWGNSWPGAS
ncbi:MAG TPA: nitroreductase family protein [Candidatus Binataceae bacterium]|nr:nitroreductase family protein [Candidatus Binataceae bacterium]